MTIFCKNIPAFFVYPRFFKKLSVGVSGLTFEEIFHWENRDVYFYLIVVINWLLNANLSLNLLKSTCDKRKPSEHED